MCKLWFTEPSKSLGLNYFVIEGSRFYMDEFRTVLANLKYDCPIDFISAEDGVCQISKDNCAVLLHTPTIGEERYIAGLVSPNIDNPAPLRWNTRLQGFTIWLLTGDLCIITLMIVFATFSGTQAMTQLEEFFTQNIAIVFGIPLFLFGVLSLLMFLFNRSNIPEQNQEAAEMVRSDLKESLEQLCSEFHTEEIETTQELPKEIDQALEKLLSAADTVDKLPTSILNIDLPPAEDRAYRSYG
ncbi:MAG: hypothetical protein GF309_06905 [Candidatus Lokiarchaeota archaeon]|nr:hypothetical protein [Candidatus Lokiarchaeota archaeon]